MVKFLSLNWLYAATTFGFSWRHGPHQLAQKSISTYFPLNEERATVFPLVSGKLKSGAFAGPLFFFHSLMAPLSGNLDETSLTMAAVSVWLKAFIWNWLNIFCKRSKA